jgi:hypothetical protein
MPRSRHHLRGSAHAVRSLSGLRVYPGERYTSMLDISGRRVYTLVRVLPGEHGSAHAVRSFCWSCDNTSTRLLNRFFLAHRFFGLVRGGSRGLPGGPRKSPKPRRMAQGASRGPPESSEPGPQSLKTIVFLRGPSKRPSSRSPEIVFRGFLPRVPGSRDCPKPGDMRDAGIRKGLCCWSP